MFYLAIKEHPHNSIKIDLMFLSFGDEILIKNTLYRNFLLQQHVRYYIILYTLFTYL
jgi:hypothetical protein